MKRLACLVLAMTMVGGAVTTLAESTAQNLGASMIKEVSEGELEKQITEQIKDQVKEQVQLDPFGRKIRKTNLPKNADQYLYIVEGVPNAMYEQPFEYQKDKYFSDFVEGEDYIRPKNMIVMDERYYNKENVKLWKTRTEDYLKALFSIDYRKLDQKWVDKMASMKHKNAKSYWIRYFNNMKQWYKDNHIVAEGEFKVEPSIIYNTHNGNYIRCYVKYRIKSDNAKQVSFEDCGKVKANTWYEGYVDIELSTNSMKSNGEDYVVTSISNLMNTVKQAK